MKTVNTPILSFSMTQCSVHNA